MKRKLFFLLVVLVSTIGFSSCRYEDGPFMSFTSPETRLVGYWQVGSVLLNGSEYSAENDLAHQKGSYYSFFIERMIEVIAVKDGYSLASVTGAWDFMNNEKELYIYYTIDNKTYKYTARITRLTKYELEYKYTDDNGNVWLMKMNKRSVY